MAMRKANLLSEASINAQRLPKAGRKRGRKKRAGKGARKKRQVKHTTNAHLMGTDVMVSGGDQEESSSSNPEPAGVKARGATWLKASEKNMDGSYRSRDIW